MVEQFLWEIKKWLYISAYVVEHLLIANPLEFFILIFGVIWIFCVIATVFINPIIFNYWIVPAIERKKNKKVILPDIVNYLAFGKWSCKYIFVSNEITKLYFLKKFKKNSDLLDKGVLVPLGFTILDATKSQIFFSILSFLVLRLALILPIIFLIVSKNWHVLFFCGVLLTISWWLNKKAKQLQKTGWNTTSGRVYTWIFVVLAFLLLTVGPVLSQKLVS